MVDRILCVIFMLAVLVAFGSTGAAIAFNALRLAVPVPLAVTIGISIGLGVASFGLIKLSK